jgi:HEAT repeat protein
MESEQRNLAEIIERAFGSDKELTNADLSALSDMNSEWFARFKRAWAGAPLERRSKLISTMVGLSETDFILDFTREFELGLDDENEGIRIKALEGLGLEDKYSYARPIIKALKSDESAEVRAAAAGALSKFALMTECGNVPQPLASSIFQVLIDKLEDLKEPIAVRRRALEAVAPFREELVEQYIEDYYHSDDPKVKVSALFAMGLNCAPRWLGLLIDEMRGDVAELRYEAARSSGEIGDEEAVPDLIRLLDDPDPEVQEAAIAALGKIGGAAAKGALQKLSKSANARIKEAAKAAMAELVSCEDPLSLSF